jgi:glycosyltransferase involved in cell wall biosynthesis
MIKKILVWIPLGPSSLWRGEGIAQTIENILVNFDNSLHVTLFISQKTYQVLPEDLKQKKEFHLVPMTWKGLIGIKSKFSKPKIYTDADVILEAAKEKTRIAKQYHCLTWALKNLNYLLLLFLWTKFQRHNLVFRGYRVWLPAMSIPFAQELSSISFVNFWDPFVFYYREFDDIFKYVYLRAKLILNKLTVTVVTQSHNNKDYLVRMMKIPQERIVVIENGSPNYRPLIRSHFMQRSIGNGFRATAEFKKEVIQEISTVKDDYEFGSAEETMDALRNINILDRLRGELYNNTKIIFVSTQVRPYKGIPQLFKLLDQLINTSPDLDFRIIVTCKVPKDILNKYSWCQPRIYEITRTPNIMHAHLYLLADLVVHSSYNEGGLGAYPAYEASSLGVPAIMNIGPHTKELVSKYPKCNVAVFDIEDRDFACKKILDLLSYSGVAQENIDNIQASAISWTDASARYQQLFSSTPTIFNVI